MLFEQDVDIHIGVLLDSYVLSPIRCSRYQVTKVVAFLFSHWTRFLACLMVQASVASGGHQIFAHSQRTSHSAAM